VSDPILVSKRRQPLTTPEELGPCQRSCEQLKQRVRDDDRFVAELRAQVAAWIVRSECGSGCSATGTRSCLCWNRGRGIGSRRLGRQEGGGTHGACDLVLQEDRA
jgi:hypothetical protein